MCHFNLVVEELLHLDCKSIIDFSLAVYYNRTKISTDFCPKEKTASLAGGGPKKRFLEQRTTVQVKGEMNFQGSGKEYSGNQA